VAHLQPLAGYQRTRGRRLRSSPGAIVE